MPVWHSVRGHGIILLDRRDRKRDNPTAADVLSSQLVLSERTQPLKLPQWGGWEYNKNSHFTRVLRACEKAKQDEEVAKALAVMDSTEAAKALVTMEPAAAAKALLAIEPDAADKVLAAMAPEAAATLQMTMAYEKTKAWKEKDGERQQIAEAVEAATTLA